MQDPNKIPMHILNPAIRDDDEYHYNLLDGIDVSAETIEQRRERIRQEVDPYTDHTTAEDENKNPLLNLRPEIHIDEHIEPVTTWQKQTLKTIPKATRGCIANHKHAETAIMNGQPHRKAQEAQIYNPEAPDPPTTYGQVMLPESYDILTDKNPEPPTIPTPAWTPDAPIEDVLHGAAHDLTTVISVMTARLRHTIGFESDHQTISKIDILSYSLSKLHYIIQASKREKDKTQQKNQTTPKRPRGRPRKTPKIKK